MTLARGFKAYCEKSVATLRAEMDLSDEDPFDMGSLASHLDIPVSSLEYYMGLCIADRHSCPLVAEIYAKTSALTFFDGYKRRILYNEKHSPVRQRSDLAHEIAHALLQHPPEGTGLSAEQEAVNEEEAAWMGGVLMLTAKQAKRIAVTKMSRAAAEIKYQLSPEMLRFRLNVTGASRLAVAG